MRISDWSSDVCSSDLNRKIRQENVPLQFQRLNLIDDFVGIVDGLRQVAEHLIHLGLRLEIEFIIRKAEPVAFPVADGGAFQLTGIDNKQNIVGVRIFLINIMGVIGGDDINIVFFGESKQGSVHLTLILHFVALNLHIIIFNNKQKEER